MEELRFYLEKLLVHQCEPGDGNCLECRSLQTIYQFLRTQIFSTVVYNETPLESRHTAGPETTRVSNALASARRPQTL